MKFRFVATLCIAILFILLISNRFLNHHSIQSNSNQVSNLKVQKVEWRLTSKKDTQEVTVVSRSMSVPQREKLKVFISTDKLNSFKVIEPIYNGNNLFRFKYNFKKKTPYYISIFLNNQTVDTKVFQNVKEQNEELFPTSILTKKTSDYRVSLLFKSLLPKTKSTITFNFDQFKKHAEFSKHQMYIVSEDGTYFQSLSPSSNKSKVKYDLNLPKEGMYKLFYEFNLNNKKQSFNYVLDVKEKQN